MTAGLQIPPCLGGEISVSGREELRDDSEVPRSCRPVQQIFRAVQPEQCRIFLSSVPCSLNNAAYFYPQCRAT
jgi:hypothetical protein